MSLFITILDAVLNNLTASMFGVMVFLFLWWYLTPSPWVLPPGIRPLPIIGHYIPFRENEIGDDKIHLYGRQYKTDIVYFKIINMNMVTILSYDLIKEVFMSDQFIDRPKTPLDEVMLRGIVQVSGPRWKEQRRFTLSTLKDFGLGRNKVEKIIQEEISSGLNMQFDETNGKSFDPTNLMMTAISNVICSMVFGHRFQYSDNKFQTFLRLNNDNSVYARQLFMGSLLPFSDWIPGDLWNKKKLKANVAALRDQLFKPEFEHHMENFNPNNIDDFIDAFIYEMKKKQASDEEEKAHWFTEEQLEKNIEDLFFAGTETTATSIRWAFLCMLHYPHVQEKLREEILSVLGKNKLPTMKDKMQMPYTEAVLLEVQRMHIVVPFLGSHASVDNQPIKIKGYVFPPNSVINCCVHSIHFDPDYWIEPEKFKPERFIGEDGKFQKDPRVCTFSFGKRACLGESLAKQELFLFFTAILQRYKLALPPGEPLPPMDRVPGITIAPKPFKLCFVKAEQ